VIKYELGLNLQMEEHKPHQVRYVQCGILNDNQFTGHIADYCGGGERTDFYFLNGEILLHMDIAGTRSKLYILAIEKVYPLLLKEIFKLETRYFYYEDGRYVAREHLKTLLIIHPKDKLIHYGVDLEPISVGNTFFSDMDEEVERMMKEPSLILELGSGSFPINAKPNGEEE